MQETKAPGRQMCRRPRRQAGRCAEDQGARQAEVQENKAPDKQRCRRTRRQAGRASEELGDRQKEVQEDKAPSRQRFRIKVPQQAKVRKKKAPGRQRFRRTRRQAGIDAGEQSTRKTKVQKNKALSS